MKVAIDISPIRGMHQFRGIGVYTKMLVKALKKVDRDNEYILTTKTSLANVDLIHYPFFDFFFMTLPLIKIKPTVVTVHDVHPLVFPDHYPPGFRGRVKYWRQKVSLGGAKIIITDSDCSARDIHLHLGIANDKIKRIYLAANPELKPQSYRQQRWAREKFQLIKPYFLYVGDINYNKNVPYLIKSFAPYAKDFDLVLVSRALKQRIPEAREILDMIGQNRLERAVKIITDLPDEPEQLAALYSGAFWYVQPSLYEGFGLPVLEAMQCGAPVVCADKGSLPEVVGKAAVMFDSEAKKSLEMTLARVMVMTKGERKKYVEAGKEQAMKFNWETTAKETIRVYQQVLKR